MWNRSAEQQDISTDCTNAAARKQIFKCGHGVYFSAMQADCMYRRTGSTLHEAADALYQTGWHSGSLRDKSRKSPYLALAVK
ncbi:hypothetical protein BM1_10594 [Bipolaris maydis]|nr:hypothetical protein BM1_10594 [Bipolaris maydis]